MAITQMHRSDIGGQTLASCSDGVGDAVVLIHGGFAADTMAAVAGSPTLTPYRRIRYHRRGYAESPRPAPVRPLSLNEHADDLSAVIEHHDGAPAHLVGHSMGALIALVLAVREPAQVRSLTLLEPPSTFASATGQEWLSEVLPLASTYAAGDVEGAVSGFLDAIYRPGWRKRMETASPGTFEQCVDDAAMGFESDIAGLDWNDGLDSDEVAAVRCPVLSVLGTDTLPVFADGRRLLHDWFPQCQDADIAGADHLLPVDHADEVASAITSFLVRSS